MTTDIDDVRKKLEEVQFEMIEASLDRIRNGYKSLSYKQREEVRKGLERVVYNLTLIDSFFNPEEALQVRIRTGFSQAELAKQLGTKASNISRYENSKVIPRLAYRSGRNYLLWLKQQGYNPYNI